jgi:hypothetical protein
LSYFSNLDNFLFNLKAALADKLSKTHLRIVPTNESPGVDLSYAAL